MTNTNRAKEKTPAVQAGQTHAAPGFVGDSLGMGEENHLRRLLGGEFGPDQVPVGRAQVATGHSAGGSALDGYAESWLDQRATRPPVADSRLDYADLARQRCTTTEQFDGAVKRSDWCGFLCHVRENIRLTKVSQPHASIEGDIRRLHVSDAE